LNCGVETVENIFQIFALGRSSARDSDGRFRVNMWSKAV